MHEWDFSGYSRIQGSDVFLKAIKVVLRCILSVMSHLSVSGFTPQPGPNRAQVTVAGGSPDTGDYYVIITLTVVRQL